MKMPDHIADPIDPVQIAPDPKALHTFHRQQLSAMLDGELSPDEAKFMLRRLEHDVELARCWERWQVCGEVLRGRAEGLLAGDFAARVMLAVQGPIRCSQSGVAARRRSRARYYWGGTGIAAALALVTAALVFRLPGEPAGAEPAVTLAPPAVSAPEMRLESRFVPVESAAVSALASPLPVTRAQAPAVAVAAAEREVRMARELEAPAEAPVSVVPRPWPRAGIETGRFAVGYGGASVRPLDPFQPRWTPPPSVLWPEPESSRSPEDQPSGRMRMNGQD